MKKFILAITTYNRINYLKDCLDSWDSTRSLQNSWTVIVADDGSSDGTLKYLQTKQFNNCDVILLQNNRIGVHQQTNTIIEKLETLPFDMCFKIDDDLLFLKEGWDILYYKTAIETNCPHLVFCDRSWSSEQLLKTPKENNTLVGSVSKLNVHGFFYTLTLPVIKTVGYLDEASFGFRGMGHVDYTVRCARAGFTNEETPWDIEDSNAFLTAGKAKYKSVLPSKPIEAYDEYNRELKERIILDNNRLYIPNNKLGQIVYSQFKEDVIDALTHKVCKLEDEKKELDIWHKKEQQKIGDYYLNKYKHIPQWCVSLGKIFRT